jgi:hypothetical protein
MPTTVHIPPPLLAAVDRKARALRVSRNRLIVRALEREVDAQGWSPNVFEALQTIDPEAAAAFDDTMSHVGRARRSKRPVRL